MADRPILTGSFSDPDSADRAYSSFRDRGYTDDDIHVMMSDETKNQYHSRSGAAIDEGSKALEGAGTGAAIGGTVGGILGALAAVGTAIAIPGLGIAIAGPIAGALAGAGAGGATGSLLGALVGAGIPEEHAKTYETDIKEGRIVMGVHPRDDDHDYLQSQYSQHGATNVYSSGSRMGGGSSMGSGSGMSGGSGSIM